MEFMNHLRTGDVRDVTTEADPDGKEKMYIKIKTGKRVSVPMDALTEDEVDLLKLLDGKNAGQITMHDIVRVQKEKEKGEQDARAMKKVIIGLVILVLVLFIGMFAITLSVVEMAKEMRSDDTGVMMTSSDTTAKMGTSDREVTASGELVQTSSSRRLQDGSSLNGIGVQVAMHEQVLSSSLPNAYFSSLQEVSVYSSLSTLEVSIHGFSRVAVLNTKCGNIVNLHTAWGGTITLDGDDLSFDNQTAQLFENAGIIVAVGGTQGRRLQGGAQAKGLFRHIGEIGEEWECPGVPLPSLPDRFRYTETVYVPCRTEAGASTTVEFMEEQQQIVMQECDSAYGGKIPGAQILPPKLALATLSKAEGYLLKAGLLEEDVRTHYFLKMDTIWMRSLNWEIQRDLLPNHPGREEVTIFDKANGLTATFQRWVRETDPNLAPDLRAYCVQVDAADSAMAHASDMLEDPHTNTSLHFEYLDLIQENGRFYRHFRLMPSDQLVAQQNGMKPEEERDSYKYYEYWDDSETLEPYRMLHPEGMMTMYHTVQQNFTDADILAELAAMGLNPTNAAVCPENMVNMTTHGIPRMRSLYTENPQKVTEFYIDYFSEVNATSQAELSYLGYAYALMDNPLPMPDPCKERCKEDVTLLLRLMRNDADSCTELLNVVNCVRSLPSTICQQAPFFRYLDGDIDACSRSFADIVANTTVQELANTSVQENSSGRRLAPAPPPSNVAAGTSATALFSYTCNGFLKNTFIPHPIPHPDMLNGKVRMCLNFGCTCPGPQASDDDLPWEIMNGPDLGTPFQAGVNNWLEWGKGPPCPWCSWKKDMTGELQFIWGYNAGNWNDLWQLKAVGSMILNPLLKLPDKPVSVSVSWTGLIELSNNVPQDCYNRNDFDLVFKGSQQWSVNLALDFCQVSLPLAAMWFKLETGIDSTHEGRNCGWNWDEGRRRRRWWTRRRSWWSCAGSVKMCSVYIRGTAAREIWLGPIAAVRGWAQAEYWIQTGLIDLTVGISTYNFWHGWNQFFALQIFQLHLPKPGGKGEDNYFMASQGEGECPSGKTKADQHSCLDAAKKVIPSGQSQGRKSLQTGSWSHIPSGCSIQLSNGFGGPWYGDWAAHYNTNSNGASNNYYSPVCKANADGIVSVLSVDHPPEPPGKHFIFDKPMTWTEESRRRRRADHAVLKVSQCRADSRRRRRGSRRRREHFNTIWSGSIKWWAERLDEASGDSWGHRAGNPDENQFAVGDLVTDANCDAVEAVYR
jgi:hypothetical protein